MSTPGDAPPTLSGPFWDGCRQGELRVQRCPACGHYQFYPRPRCLACGAPDPVWVPVSGRGTVASYTQSHIPLDERWVDEVPYWLALVKLAEGPTLMTNLVDVETARIGMAVTVRFQTRGDRCLPVFTEVGS